MQIHDVKSVASAGANPAAGTNWSEPESGACGSGQARSWLVVRPRVRRPGRQHQYGISTGRASQALVLTGALLETEVWRKSTAFRQVYEMASRNVAGLVD